jgi:hypothetical protein
MAKMKGISKTAKTARHYRKKAVKAVRQGTKKLKKGIRRRLK